MTDENRSTEVKPDRRDVRIERLEELLHDIALIADGHKSSTLYIGGENAALINIRNMAATAIGLGDRLRENGTLFSTDPSVIRTDC
ncbi:hypothetical protein HFO56_02255 [Rhizobium laguerreae]|uniref:hypothetical protein n=1 Tax=Rhizobium laguerreae TaxID=1076926 RepID=UPI001C929ACF|nr:hypothetical protein [Rhizobium laguerreae]MBY3151223.1 hypothetical protein [Rhizobium laguerreae]